MHRVSKSLDECSDENNYCPIITAITNDQPDMLHKLTQSHKKGGYGLSIKIDDGNGNNAVLIAVAKGKSAILRELVKPKNKGGFGLSIDAKNKFGSDVVLVAAANGNEEILKELVEKEKRGGYGRKINVKNNYKSGAILAAVGTGQIQMLKLLTTAVNEGGFGLSLAVKNVNGYGPIEMAIINNQLEMLQILMRDKVDGGYGLAFEEMDATIKLAQKYSRAAYLWLISKNLEVCITTGSILCLISNRDMFDAIKLLPDENQILLLNDCLKPNTRLGQQFWALESLFEDSGLEKGIFKEINDHLKKINLITSAVWLLQVGPQYFHKNRLPSDIFWPITAFVLEKSVVDAKKDFCKIYNNYARCMFSFFSASNKHAMNEAVEKYAARKNALLPAVEEKAFQIGL